MEPLRIRPEEFEEYELPWMPVVIDDLMGSGFVAMLSDLEYRCYLKLLFFQWRYGAIPYDMKRLGKYLGKDKRTTMLVMQVLCKKFDLKVNFLYTNMCTQNTVFVYNLKLHEKRLKQIEIHRLNSKNGELYGFKSGSKGGNSEENSRATAHRGAVGGAVSNLEPRNLEPRELGNKSLVNLVDCIDLERPQDTRPLQKIVFKKMSPYDAKTGQAITSQIEAHRRSFDSEVSNQDPIMKKLFLALLGIPGIDSEHIRLLAYVIQAKEAKNVKNRDKRVGYAIRCLKNPKHPPADNCLQKAKLLINHWAVEGAVEDSQSGNALGIEIPDLTLTDRGAEKLKIKSVPRPMAEAQSKNEINDGG